MESLDSQETTDSDLFKNIKSLISRVCEFNPRLSEVWNQESFSEADTPQTDQHIQLNLLNPPKTLDLPRNLDISCLGSILNDHNRIDANFLKSLEPQLPGFFDAIIRLIETKTQFSIFELIKLLTLSSFAVKINNFGIDEENIKKITSFFESNFLRIIKDENISVIDMDLLIMRFLQILYFTMSNNFNFGFDIEFWGEILGHVSTETTWDYIFNPLWRYLNKVKKNDNESDKSYKKKKKSIEQSFCKFILETREAKDFMTNDDIYVFFCKNKLWASVYVSFYLQKAIGASDNIKISTYFIEVKKLLKAYFQNSKRRNIEYIIRESKLSEVFKYVLIYRKIFFEIDEIAKIQMQSNSCNRVFFTNYFSKVKELETWYNDIATAEQTILDLLLLTYTNIEFYDEFSVIAVDFVYKFFENVYNSVRDYNLSHNGKTLGIFSLSFQFLPAFWDKLSEFIKENTITTDYDIVPRVFKDRNDRLSKGFFLSLLIDLHSEYSKSNSPDYFVTFIECLIDYLQNNNTDSLFSMENLYSQNLNEFSLTSINYKDPDYCAKILMEICWNSEFIKAKFEEEKKKSVIEEEKNKEISENISQLSEAENIASESIQPATDEEKKEFEEPKIKFSKHSPIKTDNPETSSISISKTDAKLISSLLEHFKESYILNILFQNEKFQPQVQKWLLSQLKSLFDLSLKWSKKTVNFIADTNSFLLKLIPYPIIKANSNQMQIFKEIAKSNVLKEGFNKIVLPFTPKKPYYDQVYFASLPNDLAGITIFGGDILINSKYNNNEEINICAQKIVFVHELAHYVRKTNEGYYDISKKTPTSDKIYRGVPGKPKKKTLIAQDEGGAQLEAAIFGLFVTGVSEPQINFLNSIFNWNSTLDTFNSKLEKLYSKNQTIYNLGRCSHKIYHFNRKLHHH